MFWLQISVSQTRVFSGIWHFDFWDEFMTQFRPGKAGSLMEWRLDHLTKVFWNVLSFFRKSWYWECILVEHILKLRAVPSPARRSSGIDVFLLYSHSFECIDFQSVSLVISPIRKIWLIRPGGFVNPERWSITWWLPFSGYMTTDFSRSIKKSITPSNSGRGPQNRPVIVNGINASRSAYIFYFLS